MILVNNPGSWEYIYAPFKHAAWNGCTPTDLVFPFFLFIVGISISYALKGVKTNPNGSVYGKLLKRTFLLFAFGFFLNLFPDFDFATVRIPGVLQRISLVFLFSALAFLHLSKRGIVILSGILLLTYWVLMCFVPSPAFDAGMLEPGKNFSAWLDNLLLEGHLWRFSKTWDPEGVLSTIPSIASGLSGVLAGLWMNEKNDPKDKLIQLFVWGIILILVGLAWNLQFPINKSLWTSSFMLYTSGIALLALAVSYWWIDMRGETRGTMPFLVFGSNAITAYMLAELMADIVAIIRVGKTSLKGAMFNAVSSTGIPGELASLILAVLWVCMIYIPVYVLYRKKIFLKV